MSANFDEYGIFVCGDNNKRGALSFFRAHGFDIVGVYPFNLDEGVGYYIEFLARECDVPFIDAAVDAFTEESGGENYEN